MFLSPSQRHLLLFGCQLYRFSTDHENKTPGRGGLRYQYTIVDKLFHYGVILLVFKVLKPFCSAKATERPWGKLPPQGLSNRLLIIHYMCFCDSLQWIS